MVRQTSIDTYNAIKKAGLLSKHRFAAYRAIYRNGPLTGSELNKQLLGM